jgi:hypothetical protein
MINIKVEIGTVTQFKCDVLVLKHAQAFYGSDARVADALMLTGKIKGEIHPKPGQFVLLESHGAVGAEHVLFVGVPRLGNFDYSDIRFFAALALKTISKELPHSRHVAMTVHGRGFGLDEREAFMAQLGGFNDAEQSALSVEQISIVERDPEAAQRLEAILRDRLTPSYLTTLSALRKPSLGGSISAGAASKNKPHVFVAMPFNKELQDVYVFGIQGPVNAAGYLCERMDMVSFTGDILARIKSRIETAALVIADLSGANANVYLEVGYAWGRDRPTLLLVRKKDDLTFDVRGQRCIVYENIVDLANKLQADLANLKT